MKNVRNFKIVAIGGGTGLSNLLRGLKKYFSNLTAVVTMTDDGRSSGRLRQDLNILPPGDVRNCIVALADEEPTFNKLFAYRFPHGRGLKGHNLGNLILVALEDITGSFKKAVQELSEFLAIRGRVLPSTYENVILSASLENGRVVWGQSNIAIGGHRSEICKVQLHPENASANPDVLKAIREADIILIGPGSLYTSIIPNFLIKEINQAIRKVSAKKIYLCNVSTERGETENFTVEDHLKALIKYTSNKIVNLCLVNNKLILKSSGKRLGEVSNITTDKEKIESCQIIQADLIDEERPLHHDSQKLAREILKILSSRSKESKIK